MQMFIADTKVAAVVALEGLKGRTVEIQTEDNKSVNGKVSGIAIAGLNLDGQTSVSYRNIFRIKVTG